MKMTRKFLVLAIILMHANRCSKGNISEIRIKNPAGIKAPDNSTIPYGETLSFVKRLDTQTYLVQWKNLNLMIDAANVCELEKNPSVVSSFEGISESSAIEMKTEAYEVLKKFYKDSIPEGICRVNKNEFHIIQVVNIDCKKRRHDGIVVFFVNSKQNLFNRVVFENEKGRRIPAAYGGALIEADNFMGKETSELEKDPALFNVKECHFDY